MNLCESNKAVSEEIKNFILNVPNVKEESITDYLVWKWRDLDKRFNYINISTFTRQEESATTGADFEMELWLIGKSYRFPLLIQAKKFVKSFDSYVNKLNYPNGTQAQLSNLIRYSLSRNLLPFYLFYSLADSATQIMCPFNDVNQSGIFMADAYTIKDFADGLHGKRISKNALMKSSNPFHCIFCCPLSLDGNYFIHYFPKLARSSNFEEGKQLPDYVSLLLGGRIEEIGVDERRSLLEQNELYRYRKIAVYDLRDYHRGLNNSQSTKTG